MYLVSNVYGTVLRGKSLLFFGEIDAPRAQYMLGRLALARLLLKEHNIGSTIDDNPVYLPSAWFLEYDESFKPLKDMGVPAVTMEGGFTVKRNLWVISRETAAKHLPRIDDDHVPLEAMGGPDGRWEFHNHKSALSSEPPEPYAEFNLGVKFRSGPVWSGILKKVIDSEVDL